MSVRRLYITITDRPLSVALLDHSVAVHATVSADANETALCNLLTTADGLLLREPVAESEEASDGAA